MVTKEQWQELASRGFLVGPKESEKHFLSRTQLPPVINPILKEPFRLVFELFGIGPDWIKVDFSKKGLFLWEGGYFEVEEGKASKLILHPALEKSEKIAGYRRDEIIAHEMVHAMRETFDEPVFEEILSYQTSRGAVRRILGPLFRSSIESLFLFVFTIATLLFSFFSLLPMLGLILFLGFLFVRRMVSEFYFRKTVRQAEKVVGKNRALTLLLFLTDSEIRNFSSWDIDHIIDYLKSEKSLRLEQLRAFFNIGCTE